MSAPDRTGYHFLLHRPSAAARREAANRLREPGARTDDNVTRTGRSWDLDNEGYDDFERGHTDTFDLDPQSPRHERRGLSRRELRTRRGRRSARPTGSSRPR